MMKQIRAWRGTLSKADVLAKFDARIAADELAAGTYGDTEDGKWRGCAVRCLTD